MSVIDLLNLNSMINHYDILLNIQPITAIIEIYFSKMFLPKQIACNVNIFFYKIKASKFKYIVH